MEQTPATTPEEKVRNPRLSFLPLTYVMLTEHLLGKSESSTYKPLSASHLLTYLGLFVHQYDFPLDNELAFQSANSKRKKLFFTPTTYKRSSPWITRGTSLRGDDLRPKFLDICAKVKDISLKMERNTKFQLTFGNSFSHKETRYRKFYKISPLLFVFAVNQIYIELNCGNHEKFRFVPNFHKWFLAYLPTKKEVKLSDSMRLPIYRKIFGTHEGIDDAPEMKAVRGIDVVCQRLSGMTSKEQYDEDREFRYFQLTDDEIFEGLLCDKPNIQCWQDLYENIIENFKHKKLSKLVYTSFYKGAE